MYIEVRVYESGVSRVVTKLVYKLGRFSRFTK